MRPCESTTASKPPAVQSLGPQALPFSYLNVHTPPLHEPPSQARHSPVAQAPQSSGQSLHVGPVRLESSCKIGMRAGVANDVTVGRGAWITVIGPPGVVAVAEPAAPGLLTPSFADPAAASGINTCASLPRLVMAPPPARRG